MNYVNRLQVFDQKQRQALDLMFKDIYYGSVRIHDHSSNVQGGQLDWDTAFSDAVHTHQSNAEGGTLDHGLALTGLTDDDHTQYALLAGRSGGQSLIGGTAASNDLNLQSTSNGTKGFIICNDKTRILFASNEGLLLDANNGGSGYMTITDDGSNSGAKFGYDATNDLLTLGHHTYGDAFSVSSTGNVGIVSGKKFFVDGILQTGDTYLTEVSGNVARIVCGGTNVCTFRTNLVDVDANIDLSIQSTKFYWDGGGNTYSQHASADVLTDTVGGTAILTRTSSDVYTVDYTDYSATSTIVGWSSFTTQKIFYKKIGKLVFVWFDIAGTSNSTSVTFTLPYALSNDSYTMFQVIRVADNGAFTTTVGMARILTNASTVTCFRDITGTTWTASSTKTVQGQFCYQATA